MTDDEIKKRMHDIWVNYPRINDFISSEASNFEKAKGEYDKATTEHREMVLQFFADFNEYEFDPTRGSHCLVKSWQGIWDYAEEKMFNQKPEIETFALTPEDAEQHGVGRSWFLCWEAGPNGWGRTYSSSSLSMRMSDAIQPPPEGCHYETYWGFDLLLCEPNP